LQPVRSGLIPFNAALVGFVEAHRDDDAEKNRLCPTNPFANTPLDWARGTLIQMGADRTWSKEPDLQAWLGSYNKAGGATGVVYKWEANGELDPAQVIVWAYEAKAGAWAPKQEIPKG